MINHDIHERAGINVTLAGLGYFEDVVINIKLLLVFQIFLLVLKSGEKL